jgi:hypothetical protein
MGSIGPYGRETAIRIANVLRKRREDIGYNHCQEAARKVYGVDSDGTGTAAADATTSAHLHRTNDPMSAPRGTLHRWIGGSDGAGHVAVSLGRRSYWGRRGYCLTPGGPSDGRHWIREKVSDVTRRWNLTYIGWDEQIDGKRI